MRSIDAQAIDAPAGLSSEAIRAHPLFPRARLAYIDAVLTLYEMKPPLVELMRDAARIMIYGVVMSYWGGYRDTDRATWLTVSRLKETIALFDIASDRQIDHILARLIDTGFVTHHRPDQDARVRIILPTPMMVSHDLDWMRAHYIPLSCLYGEAAYAMAIHRHAGFHPYLRAASIPLFPHIAENILRQNSPMTRLLNRAVGILTLMKGLRLMAGTDDTAISHNEIGPAFGVSRTHVRSIFSLASRHGDAAIDGRGRFNLLPPLLSAFDRLMADGMVVSATAYDLAENSYRNDLTEPSSSSATLVL